MKKRKKKRNANRRDVVDVNSGTKRRNRSWKEIYMDRGEESGLKVRVKAVDREQMVMRAVDVERLIDEDHPARSIWEFVGRQDLGRFYREIKTVEGGLGRTPWDPRMMITLWVFAYSEGVGSAREIERLCEYHPAYQWITGMSVVNYHSLSDFRVENGEALKKLFVEILAALESQGLITMTRVMQDGTKLEAAASKSSFRKEGKLRGLLRVAAEQVEALEQTEEGQENSERVRQAKRRASRERKKRLEAALKELESVRESKSGREEKDKVRVSTTDPDARIMKQSNGGYSPSYNVQVTTDSQEKIIVGVRVSQAGNDYGELVPAIEEAKQNTGRSPEQVVVDGGYISAANVMSMHEKQIELIGPLPDNTAKTAGLARTKAIDPGFRAEEFIYDPDRDRYTCPLGQTLRYEAKQPHRGDMRFIYKSDPKVCATCKSKQQCCSGSEHGIRSITRKERLPIMAKFEARMVTEEAREIYKQRSAVAEFPNLWLKEKLGARKFKLRGLAKVGIEALWLCLTYNIINWIRISSSPVESGLAT